MRFIDSKSAARISIFCMLALAAVAGAPARPQPLKTNSTTVIGEVTRVLAPVSIAMDHGAQVTQEVLLKDGAGTLWAISICRQRCGTVSKGAEAQLKAGSKLRVTGTRTAGGKVRAMEISPAEATAGISANASIHAPAAGYTS